MTPWQLEHYLLYFMALYRSEGWHDQFLRLDKVSSKAKAVVLFDRVITRRFE